MCAHCRRGQPCATCLAETHPAAITTSTLHTGNGLAVVPNYDGQEAVVAFARAAIEQGRKALGL